MINMISSVLHFSIASGSVIRVYLSPGEGKKAGFIKGNEGRTPFDWLRDKKL